MSPARKPAIVEVRCYECGWLIEWAGDKYMINTLEASPSSPTWEHQMVGRVEGLGGPHDVLPVFIQAK